MLDDATNGMLKVFQSPIGLSSKAARAYWCLGFGKPGNQASPACAKVSAAR